MVCGLQYTYIHTKLFQFIAEECASLHSQIFHAGLYHPRPRKPLTTPFANLPAISPTLLAHCPSTCACKHTKPHSTLLTRFSTTMSYISSTTLYMLICNIHYCRLAIQMSSISIKPWPQILACFFLLSKLCYSCLCRYYVPHSQSRCCNIQHQYNHSAHLLQCITTL